MKISNYKYNTVNNQHYLNIIKILQMIYKYTCIYNIYVYVGI